LQNKQTKIASFFLSPQMLPAIKHVVATNFVFQQDSASVHWAWAGDTIELLQRETPDFISPISAN